MKVSIRNMYTIINPYIEEDVTYFSFIAQIGGVSITLEFKWINERWLCWVTFPTGEKRKAAGYTNVLQWSLFNDYGIIFTYPVDLKITKRGINNIAIVVFEWGET